MTSLPSSLPCHSLDVMMTAPGRQGTLRNAELSMIDMSAFSVARVMCGIRHPLRLVRAQTVRIAIFILGLLVLLILITGIDWLGRLGDVEALSAEFLGDIDDPVEPSDDAKG